MALSLTQRVQNLLSSLDSEDTFCFLAFNKVLGSIPVRILKTLLNSTYNIPKTKVDSDEQGSELSDSLERIRNTKCLVLMLTKQIFSKPIILAEVAIAVKQGIPLIAIKLADSGYDFDQETSFLKKSDMLTRLENETPGFLKSIEKEGFTFQEIVNTTISSVPNLVSLPLDYKEPPQVVDAQIEKILETILIMIRKTKNTGK